MTDRLQLVRDLYTAWRTADRELIERVLADGYTFSSPPDPSLDRAGYFERCWPGAGTSAVAFEFVRLVEVGEEVLVTYIATRHDGTRFQNTEIFGFAGPRVARTEVYFGWDLA
ncbi:MAG TPA: nuclear transport factor 2 family protein [Solirubrobacteraceae bacterium]|nr:nuclear transport factor 2 family protein [Solirubrobacteraceae bacterium]